MAMIRIRMTGNRDDADSLINVLHGIEGIEHVEEVDDLVPIMRDDSSSSENSDDLGGGSSTYYVEVQAPNRSHADMVREVAEIYARRSGTAVEIVDDF
jgi:hypothetical protein